MHSGGLIKHSRGFINEVTVLIWWYMAALSSAAHGLEVVEYVTQVFPDRTMHPALILVTAVAVINTVTPSECSG